MLPKSGSEFRKSRLVCGGPGGAGGLDAGCFGGSHRAGNRPPEDRRRFLWRFDGRRRSMLRLAGDRRRHINRCVRYLAPIIQRPPMRRAESPGVDVAEVVAIDIHRCLEIFQPSLPRVVVEAETRCSRPLASRTIARAKARPGEDLSHSGEDRLQRCSFQRPIVLRYFLCYLRGFCSYGRCPGKRPPCNPLGRNSRGTIHGRNASRRPAGRLQ